MDNVDERGSAVILEIQGLSAANVRVLLSARDDLLASNRDIADRSGLSEGEVFNLLAGSRLARHRASVDAVIFALRQVAEEKRQVGVLSAIVVSRILKRLETIPLRGQLAQPTRASRGSRRSRRSAATSPGTVVPPEVIRQRIVSVDGLPRQLSTVIRDQLKRDHFAIAFFGPPQCGITSMLQLVASEARKKDFDCSLVGLHLLAPTGATSNKPDASGNDGRESQKVSDFLSGQLAAKWGFKEGLPRGGSFVDWLDDALEIAEHRSRLAVIDSLTSLDDADIVVVLRLIRAAVETHSQEGTIPVSWCVGLSYLSKQEWDVVSEVSRTREFSPPIEVGWLSFEAVKKLLLEAGGQSLVDRHASTLFRQYGGQPYLTHLAAVELASHGDPENIFERALAGEGRFGHHVNAVRRLTMLGEKAAPGDQLASFFQDERYEPEDPGAWGTDVLRYFANAHILVKGDRASTFTRSGSGRDIPKAMNPAIASEFYWKLIGPLVYEPRGSSNRARRGHR